MVGIIVGLIVVLIIIIVVVNAIQQHKEKLEQEKRAKVAKLKAVIDETEELIINLTHLPNNPVVAEILNRRAYNAAKSIKELMPEAKGIANRVRDLEARLEASKDAEPAKSDEAFVLPDNEQQLVGILQCIKKLRATIKSEQSKGAVSAQVFTQEDQRFEAMQLKISIESLVKRGNQAYSKEMLGSARQYFEKALQTLSEHSVQTDYTKTKRAEIEQKLEEITGALKSTNAADRAKKAKDEEDDLDLLFQPKKKW
ncbi:hypothetical protein [Thalassotalea sp. PLHSN55]|uniref:hypothetical protein n=1 Tax=Thalassotalea sp. PLHSN55 TaxID=3435888 RepID=UPI003F82F42C